ncbi:MAG: hypothetical protein K2W92_07420 [Alphaproteobacteria bacterium]|nr:hypothetical protein [Alphaproteobacteria bacterium]
MLTPEGVDRLSHALHADEHADEEFFSSLKRGRIRLHQRTTEACVCRQREVLVPLPSTLNAYDL